MTNRALPLATAVIATTLLSSGVAVSQNSSQPASTASTPQSQPAKPSPYEGTATPPADDVITTSDEPTAPPPAPPKPVVTPAPVLTQRAGTGNTVPDKSTNCAVDDKSADYGIVETVPATHSDTSSCAPPNAAAAEADSDAGIVMYRPGPANALPEGTLFRARMQQDVVAGDVVPGTPFRALLTDNLSYNGRVVVPIGSELRGKVVYATPGRRISGTAAIHLRPEEFVLPDGTHYHLHAQVADTLGSNTKVTDEGNIVSKDHPVRTLAELGMGSGSGAIVGAAVGGPVGAIVGTSIGAGVATAHWLLQNSSPDIPTGSTVVFSLTDPMFLTPTHE